MPVCIWRGRRKRSILTELAEGNVFSRVCHSAQGVTIVHTALELGPVYTKRQCQRWDNSPMTLQNGIATHFQASPLISMRRESLVSLQSGHSIGADAWCKRALSHTRNLPLDFTVQPPHFWSFSNMFIIKHVTLEREQLEQHEQGPKTPRPITGNLYGVGTEGVRSYGGSGYRGGTELWGEGH